MLISSKLSSWRSQALAPTFAYSFLYPVLDSSLTYSGASNATMYDSTGTLVWKPANMLLNSATLGTQSVTVVLGQSYTLSGFGTGNVVLSGGGAGTLTGTGVNNRVSLAFVASTTSVTFTVSGSITSAQLEPTSYNSPKAYNATSGSAYYGPRFDYNPSTLALNGLLIEQSSTNLVLQSNDISNAAWSVFGGSVTPNATASMTGFTTAGKLVETATTTSFNVRQSAAVAGSALTVTFYVKQAERQRVLIRENTITGDYVSFDLTSGGSVVTAVGTGVTGSIKAAGNGYFACSMTYTPSAGTYSYGLFTLLATGAVYADATYAGTAGSGVYVGGCQIEQLYFATSYIPTLATQVTRAVETVTNTSIGGWFNASAGTFISKWISNYLGASPVTYGGNTGNIWNVGSDVPGHAAAWNNSVALATSNTAAVGTLRKDGFAYTSATRALCLNGGTVATDSNVPWPSTPTVIDFGSYNLAVQFINGWLQSFSYYNTALTNAQLQTLTT